MAIGAALLASGEFHSAGPCPSCPRSPFAGSFSHPDLFSLLIAATGASLEAETAAQAELAEALQMHAEDLLAGNNVEGSTAPAPAPADAAAAAGAPAVGAEDVSLGSKKWKARESIGGRHRMYRGYGRWLNPYEGWPGTTYRYDGSTERGVECGICMTVVDALIKRLGDQFSPLTISQEADSLCPRLGWVFRSGCRWITGTNRDVVTALIMKLTEPIDACKHLQMCPPDAWDLAHMSGEIEFASDKRGARISLGGGPLTAKSFRRPAFPHGRVETAPVGGSLGMGLGMDSLMTGDRYVAVRDEATLLPPGFASVSDDGSALSWFVLAPFFFIPVPFVCLLLVRFSPCSPLAAARTPLTTTASSEGWAWAVATARTRRATLAARE